jgi:type II secretory pathway pseudopilin PulG
VFDTVLVCLLVAGLTVAFMTYYGPIAREARHTALKVGLANIRLSTELYRALNGRYPGDLKELLSERFLIPTEQGIFLNDWYLRAQALDPSGYPVDPFGERYQYEPASGRVSSGTRGYQNW